MSDYQSMGLRFNPFEATIADETSATQYALIGREDQLKRIEDFVRDASGSTRQKRILLMGEYGTGKTHHLLRLHRAINSGDYGDRLVAVYIGSIGISIRNLYEKVIAGLSANAPALEQVIAALSRVEPEPSADRAYDAERLKENIIRNMLTVMAEVKNRDIRSIFLLIDEAEDIVQANDATQVSYFITSLLHLINATAGTPLHMIMGFSRQALSKISQANEGEKEQQPLGDALWQRMSATEPIRLGYLRPADAIEMTRDRLESARSTPKPGLAPIVEEIVPIITDLVGGHPREILTILNNAVKDALEIGQTEVNGEVLLPTLSKHISFFTKENLLDWTELRAVYEGVERENPEAADEFWRLKGKLIGEGRGLPPTSFESMEMAETMTRPIGDIRLLESRYNEIGETLYFVHDSIRQRTFKGRRYDNETEQDIDRALIALDTNPERYQSQLTSGLWQVLTDPETMSFEYIERVALNNNTLTVMLGRSPSGRTLPSVRFVVSCVKGRVAPVDLYRAMVSLIADRRADFGLLLYDGPTLTTDNAYYNLQRTLREQRQERIVDLIGTVELKPILRETDPRLLAELLLMGDPEREHPGVSPREIADTIGLEGALIDLTQGRTIPYPDEMDRRVVGFLAGRQNEEFSVPQLRDELSYKTLFADRLEELKHLNLVEKKGTKWKIPSLNRNPPWKIPYQLIPRSGHISFSEIADGVREDYLINAPPGDENRAVEWYLEILMKLELITGAEGHPGHYRLVDRGAIVDDLVSEIEPAIDRVTALIGEVDRIGGQISDADEDVRAIEVAFGRIRENLFDPGTKEISDLRGFQSRLHTIAKDLENERADSIQAIDSGVETAGLVVEKILKQFEAADVRPLFGADELEGYRQALTCAWTRTVEAQKGNNYPEAFVALTDLDVFVHELEGVISDRRQGRDPCIELAATTTTLLDEVHEDLRDLLEKGYPRRDLSGEAGSIATAIENEYKPLFNERRFPEAYDLISCLHERALGLSTVIAGDRGDCDRYRRQIAAFRSETSEPSLVAHLDKAETALESWDFAEVAMALDRFDEERVRIRTPEKTPAERFKEALESSKSFKVVVRDVPVDQAFTYLKQLYDKGEIDDIIPAFKK